MIALATEVVFAKTQLVKKLEMINEQNLLRLEKLEKQINEKNEVIENQQAALKRLSE